MNVGKVGDYWWYDRDEEPLLETLHQLSEALIGCRAINTSFDSGLFSLKASSQQGWGLINNFAVSPIITSKLLKSWPISHDEFCDEWNFFQNIPDFFDAVAFCNYTGCRIEDWRELEFRSGVNLLEKIINYSPELIVGNNEYTYIVSKQPIKWHQD